MEPGDVTFDSLIQASKGDIDLVTKEYNKLCAPEQLADRVLGILESQKGMYGGAKVDLYEHGLQTGTRAYQDGADEETVVCALLHDIGELLSPCNHGEIVAGLLRPYISDRMHWILANHEVFQGFYYFEHVGGDKNKREVFKTSPYYQDCIDFCHKYDAPSFDPNFKSMTLEEFRPMVLRVLSKPAWINDPTHPKAVAVLGKKVQSGEA